MQTSSSPNPIRYLSDNDLPLHRPHPLRPSAHTHTHSSSHNSHHHTLNRPSKRLKSSLFKSKHSPLSLTHSHSYRHVRHEEWDFEDDRYSDENSQSSDDNDMRPNYSDKVILTGRMRKKQAARSKGGELRARGEKHRLYSCCVSSEINIQQLHLHFQRQIYASSRARWAVRLCGDVLLVSSSRQGVDKMRDTVDMTGGRNQVAFVFEFGAAVFWGFSSAEEKSVLATITKFAQTHNVYLAKEFAVAEDDMAYVTSRDTDRVLVAGDVITLPEATCSQELLLSVSYAVAQSSVVSVFEHRIELKVAEYKYIPEYLSRGEKINLSPATIGDIFVIRHDLNLHSDILDIPDVLWERDTHAKEYDKLSRYLEVNGRVEVINKRLELLKELLDMLQQQMESDHINNLDCIIIWLIVIEVVVQVFGGGGMLLGFW